MNLMDRMYELNKEELAYECSLVSLIGLKNIAKNATRTMVSKAIGLTNVLFRAAGVETVSTDKYADVKSDVRTGAGELSFKSKEEITRIFKDKICERLQNANSGLKLTDDDAISTAMIKEASLLYKLDEYETPFTLADEIAKEFNKEYLKLIYKKLLTENEKDAAETDKKIFDALVGLSYEDKASLKYILSVPDFSSKSLSNCLRNKGGFRMLSKIIEYTGFDIFDNESCVTELIYSDIWGAIRPERSVMAYLIWRFTDRSKFSFRIHDDVLPSFVSEDMKENMKKRESNKERVAGELERLTADELRLKAQAKDKTLRLSEERKRMEVLEKTRVTYKDNYEKLMKEFDEAKKTSDTAEGKLSEYEEAVNDLDKSSPEYKKLLSDCRKAEKNKNELHRKLESLSNYIKEYYKQFKDCNDKNIKLETELSENKIKLGRVEELKEQKQQEYDKIIDIISFDLKTGWTMHFEDAIIEESIYREVSKNFNQAELLLIERVIKELCMADNPESYGSVRKGKDNGLLSMKVRIMSGRFVNLVYSDNADRKKLRIVRIENER